MVSGLTADRRRQKMLRSVVSRLPSRFYLFQHIKQLIYRGSVGRVVAGVDEAQVALHIYNEVAAELTGVVAVRVVKFLSL